MTSALGGRPNDQAGATFWDDTVRRVATWRRYHAIPARIALLGALPKDASAAQSWRTETLSMIQSAAWLRKRPSNPAASRRLSGAELLRRRSELRLFINEAPSDTGRLIREALSMGGAADVEGVRATVGEGRDDWILTNWVHVVELRAIETLVADLGLGAPIGTHGIRDGSRRPVPDQQATFELGR